MLFLLSWGPRMGQGALAQISDDERRSRIDSSSGRRPKRSDLPPASRWPQGFVVGFVTWVVCRVADVPAPAPLGLIIGLFSAMPYLGIVVGSIPALLLAAGFRSFTAAAVLLTVFLAMQVGQIVLSRRLRGRVIYVGSRLGDGRLPARIRRVRDRRSPLRNRDRGLRDGTRRLRSAPTTPRSRWSLLEAVVPGPA